MTSRNIRKLQLWSIILGLFQAQKGSLEVDGKIITEHNSRAWQRSIGYVPQHISLIDDTVSANIAFGIEAKDINQVAVEKASKIANLQAILQMSVSTDTILQLVSEV